MKPIFSILLAAALVFLPFSCETANEVLGVSEADAIAGLKQALEFGSDSASSSLNKVDGYFRNQALRIALPEEAKPLIENLTLIPGGQLLLDEVVLKMNRGAEMAAAEATPIFLDAITKMTIDDGFAILKGSDSAATTYLRANSTTGLTAAFKPKIHDAMESVGAATAWSSLFTKYNTIALPILNLNPFKQYPEINTDLSQYATDRALKGLFVKVREQEVLIRKDPTRRITDLLKRVFAEQDNK